jgi:HlyD family secretion protein
VQGSPAEERRSLPVNDEPYSSNSSRRNKVIVVAVVLLAVVAFFFLRKRSGSVAAEFITSKLERGAIRKVVNATGTVQAVLTVQVGSQVTGQIEALYADFNSVVKQGQLLAKIDARRYQADVNGAAANVLAAQARAKSTEADLNSQLANQASAQANVETARVARDNTVILFKRADELRQQGISSQNDYDNAKANRDSAEARYNQAVAQAQQVAAQIVSSRAQIEQGKAQVAQAEAALNQAKVNLEYTDIRSPVDGVVISRNIDVGQTVAASLQAPTLFVIAGDLSKMQLQASVDEADIGSISGAEQVRFTVDAFPNRNFIGRINEIRLEPLSVQNVVTYSVIVNVDNDRLELKPGMTANLTFTVAEKDGVLRLSNAALRYTPPGQTRQPLRDVAARENERADEKATLNGEAPPPARQAGKSAEQLAGQPAGRLPDRAAMENPSRRRPGSVPPHAVELAPGQLWKPGEKIQFPTPDLSRTRPATVWTLDANKQPQPHRVELGITDGTATEVVSGELQEGDAVIIGDSTQASTAQRTGGFFGGGGGGPPGGGPR